jgi:hypothetical protein
VRIIQVRRLLTMTHKTNGLATSGAEILPDYQERLRLLRHELDRDRKLMEARALRLDCIIGDIDIALENRTRAAKPRTGCTVRVLGIPHPRPDVTVAAVTATPRGDGYWDVTIDTLPPFRLPPLLGGLFDLLAKDNGHDVGDGLIGFKTNSYLLTELQRRSLTPDAAQRRAGRVSAKGLAQAVCDLRKRLRRIVLNGDALVQTRRAVGRRVALRKRARAIDADAR